MRHFHALFRWLLSLFRDVSGAVTAACDVYSKEWQDRGYPGDGI